MKRLLPLVLLCMAVVYSSTAAVTRLPVTMAHTWLTVGATVDGRECRFVVDTGSPATILSDRTAAALGIAGGAVATVGTTDGRVAEMRWATVGSIMLGDRELTDCRILIADDTVLDCFDIDGIIGGDILRRYVVRFSMSDGCIVLADRLSEVGEAERRHSARIRLISNKPYCEHCRLQGAKGRCRVGLLFDTGAVELSLGQWKMLSEKGVLTDLHTTGGYGISGGLLGGGAKSEMIQAQAVVPCLRFAGVDICNMPVQSGRKAIVGISVLKWGDVVIDYPGRRIYYLAGENPIEAGDGSAQRVNLRPAFDAERGVVVGSVWDTDLIDTIRAGDRITAVDGEPTDSMSMCDFYRCRFEVGQTLLTVAAADGEVRDIMMNIVE